MPAPSRRFRWLLVIALIAGAVLRLIYVADMEYKLDEDYMVQRFLAVGSSEPWPWLGMPSGVTLRNPGMSIWVFLGIGKLFGATDALGLARAVQLLNVSALFLLLFFAYRFVTAQEREPWLWAVVLNAVNPFAVWFQRKIWAQSVLPFFCVLFLMAWWRRRTGWGSFFWGLVGACLGQIHMSGFFFAAGFALWGLLWNRREIRWKAWFTGSVLGALPLIPFFVYALQTRTGNPMLFGWGEIVQLKFWVFWLTDTLGLHLGVPLGVHQGGWFAQLADFFRYPIAFGRPTYVVAVAHALTALWGIWVLGPVILRPRLQGQWFRGNGETGLTVNAALIGYGSIITLATVAIRRYYLLITYPLEWVWLGRQVLRDESRLKRGRMALTILFVLQLFISAAFIGYIHVNDGSLRGDYGPAYRVQKR